MVEKYVLWRIEPVPAPNALLLAAAQGLDHGRAVAPDQDLEAEVDDETEEAGVAAETEAEAKAVAEV